MRRSENHLTAALMPQNYRAEPVGLPGLHLVWVEEIGKFAIVRFFTEVSGAIAMVPLSYSGRRLPAERRFASYERALADGLKESRSLQ